MTEQEMQRELRVMYFEEQNWIKWLYEGEAATCDHVWDIESEFGPETASDKFYCKKCGCTSHVIWY